jgi:hypothetical protein
MELQPTVQEVEQNLESLAVRDLLLRAAELYNVRDPANHRIGQLKQALITRLSPVYDEHQQISLFEDLEGYAFLDPEDNQQIVVQHPDVPLFFRLKKSPVIKWTEILRSASQELERIHAELVRLASTEGNNTLVAELRGRQTAFNWLIEQATVRTSHRITGRFVARSENTTQGAN